MGAITTHVLDTARGRPAAGIRVRLEQLVGGAWRQIGHGATDPDGRCRTLMPDDVELEAGNYRLRFETGRYFETQEISPFYPDVTIAFTAAPGEPHYHVPLLLSPFGYTTYRGS